MSNKTFIKVASLVFFMTAYVFLFTSPSSADVIIAPVDIDLGQLIQQAIALLPLVTMVGLMGAVLVVGYTLIFSWGQDANADPVKKVRRVAMYAIIGLLVIILAPFLIALILNLLGIQGLSTIF